MPLSLHPSSNTQVQWIPPSQFSRGEQRASLFRHSEVRVPFNSLSKLPEIHISCSGILPPTPSHFSPALRPSSTATSPQKPSQNPQNCTPHPSLICYPLYVCAPHHHHWTASWRPEPGQGSALFIHRWISNAWHQVCHTADSRNLSRLATNTPTPTPMCISLPIHMETQTHLQTPAPGSQRRGRGGDMTAGLGWH